MTNNIAFPITAPDIAAEPDADVLMTETTSEEQNLNQDLLHTLMALPGTNADLPLDRGVGIMQYLSGTDLTGAAAAIEIDFRKDPRVLDCLATITAAPDGSGDDFIIDVQIETTSGVQGLSFGWSQTGVRLLPGSA